MVKHIPEFPEAAAEEDICLVANAPSDKSGMVKIVCQCGNEEQIRAFMNKWGSNQWYGWDIWISSQSICRWMS